MYIRDLQHPTNRHPTASHQFEHQPIPYFGSSENDLVNGFFLDDFPP
jgi:hypothetical protein